ncbi:MAG: prepilin-type N-terminal cleavage/methylation domain-containing protein [Deltaproteobacteria bacterium]|nr:prepilin-type N-terminal cleavage/methylation domain-containing protein [Deltaproteobacteria bacterium]
MRPFHRVRGRRGMTLVEVMVAITILLIMAAMIFETLSNSIQFNELLSQRDATTRGARVALGTMRRAISLAYLTCNQGNEERYETLFVGVDEDPDQLIFSSVAHQRLYMDTRESDQGEISFFAEEAPDEVGNGYVLFLRESGIVDEEPAEDGRVLPLAYNVRSLDLKYLDQPSGEWRDEWDTRSPDTPYRLPRAVQIGLVMIAPDPEDPERTVDVPFLATVRLRYASPMVNAQTLLAQQLIAQGQVAAGQTPSVNPLTGLPIGTCQGPNNPLLAPASGSRSPNARANANNGSLGGAAGGGGNPRVPANNAPPGGLSLPPTVPRGSGN